MQNFITTCVVGEKNDFIHFGIHKNMTALYGRKPDDIIEVELSIADNQDIPTENSDEADYWGYFDNESKEFKFIYQSYFQIDMCFPNGVKHAESIGRGKAYRLNAKVSDKTFDELFQQALDLKTEEICKIKDGECQAMRLGLKENICTACSGCNHFGGACKTKNIACKVWVCPQMEQFQTDDFKLMQEEILKKSAKLGYKDYCLSKEEMDNGVDTHLKYSTNSRLDKILSRPYIQ